MTRELLLEEINASVKELRESPTRENIAERLDTRCNRILRKFGKWQDLLKEAGLQPVPLGRRSTDEECYENIVELWTHYGRQPNFQELNRPPSRVGSKAYVLRWGGWRAALAAFISYINQSPDSQREAQAKPTPVEPSTNPPNPPPILTSEPRSLGLAMRYRVLRRDRFRCQICGRSPAKDLGVELHVDHIVPWSKGGQNTEENLRTLCSKCNLGRGQKTKCFDPKPLRLNASYLNGSSHIANAAFLPQ